MDGGRVGTGAARMAGSDLKRERQARRVSSARGAGCTAGEVGSGAGGTARWSGTGAARMAGVSLEARAAGAAYGNKAESKETRSSAGRRAPGTMVTANG